MLCKCLPPASASSLVECGNPCRYVEVSGFLFIQRVSPSYEVFALFVLFVRITSFVADFLLTLLFYADVFIFWLFLSLLLTCLPCATDSVEPLTWPCKLGLRLVLKWRPERRLRIAGQCRMFGCRKRSAFRAAPSVRRWRIITRRFQIGGHRRRVLVNVRAVIITVYKSRVSDKNIVTTVKSSANITGRCSTNRMTSVSITHCVGSVPFP